MTSLPFVDLVTSHIFDEKDSVLVVGNELDNELAGIITNQPIIKTTGSDVSHIVDLLLKNIKIGILRIGSINDPDKAFNTYVDMVTEGGLIILDDPKRFESHLERIFLDEVIQVEKRISYLGKFSTVFSSDEMVIIRREAFESNISFAIVIPTYHRTNGRSRSSVERCLKSIAEQTYKKYKVFLIGDRYEKSNEFESFSEILPSSHIETINLPVAWERDNCKIGHNLWTIGGANAVNTGLNLAVEQGYTYYVHLDDDDFWHCFHLRNMAMAYTQFPKAYFVATHGYMNINAILPYMSDTLAYNNFNCRSGQLFHSSFGFRLDKFPLRYTQFDPNIIPEQLYPPADGAILEQVNRICLLNSYSVLAIPMITCFHVSQGEIFSR